MKPADVLEDPRVLHPLNDFLADWGQKPVSDIVDAEGRQYVDFVMEGGGVLGFALVGYCHVLERAGIRFLGIGGTSAGAITATLLAGIDSPATAKSERLLELLADVDMSRFVDGDADARDFVQAALAQAGLVKLVWKGMQIVDNLSEDLGLNPGRAFQEWLTGALAQHGIRTAADLEVRLDTLPRLKHRVSGKVIPTAQAGARLALVAAEISTETKVVLPAMAGLFWADPTSVSPARFVRASMSIPFFFKPCIVPKTPQGAAAAALWDQHAGYRGKLPKQAVFIDGGIMSNFPIDLFHDVGVPAAPTFGVKLGGDRSAPKAIEGPLQLAAAMFDSARHCRDYEFFLKNPDYRRLVSVIDTGKHHWLDFGLDDEAKIDLFARGVVKAIEFLRGFDWAAYKAVRAAPR